MCVPKTMNGQLFELKETKQWSVITHIYVRTLALKRHYSLEAFSISTIQAKDG